jgi:glutamate formiminotransferase
VQANGFWIEELGRAQVSMNLLDFATTPIWLVWETVRDIAGEDGVDLAESELIGLAPLAALLAVADRVDAPADDPVEDRLAAAAAFLRLRDYSPMQALELRLEAARASDRVR